MIASIVSVVLVTLPILTHYCVFHCSITHLYMICGMSLHLHLFKYLIRISLLYLVMGFIMTFSYNHMMYIYHIHFLLPSHLSPTPADLLHLLLLSLSAFTSILCDSTSFLRVVPISIGERAFDSSMGISSVTTLLKKQMFTSQQPLTACKSLGGGGSS